MSTPAVIPPPKATPIEFNDHGIQLRTFEDAYRFATAVAKSKLAPKGLETAEQILIALQAGLELGFSPMRALSAVAVVNGRPSLMGEAALAKIRQSGVCKLGPTITTRGEGDKLTGVVRFQRDGMSEPLEVTFSVADAKRAGLWGKSGPWTQYPTTMLEWRAVARTAKLYFSDILLGLVIAEEAQDYPQQERVGRWDKAIAAADPARRELDPLLAEVTESTAPSAQPEGPSAVGENHESTGGAVSAFNAEGVCRMCSRTEADVKDFGHERGCDWTVPA